MKKAIEKGVHLDSLLFIDQPLSDLINRLHGWRSPRDRQRASPPSHRRASEHCLHTALPGCFNSRDVSQRLAAPYAARTAQRFEAGVTSPSKPFNNVRGASAFA